MHSIETGVVVLAVGENTSIARLLLNRYKFSYHTKPGIGSQLIVDIPCPMGSAGNSLETLKQ